MSDLIIYWKNYWNDLQEKQNEYIPCYHSHKDITLSIKPGDSVWIIVTGGDENPGEWRLLERIVVTYTRTNDPDKGRGRFGVWGNTPNDEYYELASQDDFAPIIHQLKFRSGKRIPPSVISRNIGNYLQAPRWLCSNDSDLLEKYSKQLIRCN